MTTMFIGFIVNENKRCNLFVVIFPTLYLVLQCYFICPHLVYEIQCHSSLPDPHLF